MLDILFSLFRFVMINIEQFETFCFLQYFYVVLVGHLSAYLIITHYLAQLWLV